MVCLKLGLKLDLLEQPAMITFIILIQVFCLNAAPLGLKTSVLGAAILSYSDAFISHSFGQFGPSSVGRLNFHQPLFHLSKNDQEEDPLTFPLPKTVDEFRFAHDSDLLSEILETLKIEAGIMSESDTSEDHLKLKVALNAIRMFEE
jgi:hypothetical protein